MLPRERAYYRRPPRVPSRASHPRADRWIVPYADLVTLLLALFVVAFVASQGRHQEQASARPGVSVERTHSPRQDQLQAQDAAPFEPRSHERPDSMSEVRARIVALVSLEGLGRSVRTRLERRGLIVSLFEAGFFEAGHAEPRDDAVPLIDTLGRLLASSDHHIRIEGHTDDTPIHTAEFPSNWELSTARATWLVARLATRFALAPERLSAAGYGEFRPVASNETPSGRAMNRRVDIVVLSPAVVFAEEPSSVPRETP